MHVSTLHRNKLYDPHPLVLSECSGRSPTYRGSGWRSSSCCIDVCVGMSHLSLACLIHLSAVESTPRHSVTAILLLSALVDPGLEPVLSLLPIAMLRLKLWHARGVQLDSLKETMFVWDLGSRALLARCLWGVFPACSLAWVCRLMCRYAFEHVARDSHDGLSRRWPGSAAAYTSAESSGP